MSLFSVNTNLSALAALQSLDQTQEALNTAQNAVSTGKTVGQASDNPAIYSISNTINANIAGLSAVSDSLNFGAQVIQTASSALTNVQTVLENLQQTVTESGQTGISTTTLQSQVTAELASIDQYGRSATFNGVNVLTTTGDSGAANGTLNIVEGLSGTTYNIANQAATLNAGATTLSQALGLGGLSVTGGGTTGVSLTLNQNLLVSSFSPTTAATPAAAGTDAVMQLTPAPKPTILNSLMTVWPPTRCKARKVPIPPSLPCTSIAPPSPPTRSSRVWSRRLGKMALRFSKTAMVLSMSPAKVSPLPISARS